MSGRLVDVSSRPPSYPIDDGDVTVIGRHRQVVVAVWVLGFMGGPLPALLALVVRPGRGTYHRLVVAAAWFWSAAAVVGAVSVYLALSRESAWYMIGWVVVLVAGLVASGIAVHMSTHRI